VVSERKASARPVYHYEKWTNFSSNEMENVFRFVFAEIRSSLELKERLLELGIQTVWFACGTWNSFVRRDAFELIAYFARSIRKTRSTYRPVHMQVMPTSAHASHASHVTCMMQVMQISPISPISQISQILWVMESCVHVFLFLSFLLLFDFRYVYTFTMDSWIAWSVLQQFDCFHVCIYESR